VTDSVTLLDIMSFARQIALGMVGILAQSTIAIASACVTVAYLGECES
jgi:hypothetical protein